MNIKRAKEEIINTVRAYQQKDESGNYMIPAVRQRPILLIGPPGVGKTAIMEQAARECGIALAAYTMTHHTRQSAMGLPFISKKIYDGKEYSVTEYTMSEIIASVHDRMEETGLKQGILFIDEINCVSETLAPVMLQFLQGKTFGNAKVPEGWIIVAAGNPPEYNRSVREFDVVTLDRVKMIPVEADYDVWREYARSQGIHGAVTAYLDARRENFYKIETTVDGRHFVTARGWEDLSELLYAYERLNVTVNCDVVSQYICDPAIAADFANYLELYYVYEKTYNMDSILNGEASEMMYGRLANASFDERVSVVSLLLGRLNQNFAGCSIRVAVADGIFELLKTFRKRISTDMGAGPVIPLEAMQMIIHEQSAAYEQKKRAGLYSRDEELTSGTVIKELEKMSVVLASSGECDSDKAFELVRTEFVRMTDYNEAYTTDTLDKLNNAFTFMEKAFGESPQMVLFTTELSAGYYSMHFIEANGCEKFYQYNRSLVSVL